MLARAELLRDGGEEGADVFAGEDARDDLRIARGGDDHRGAGERGAARGLHLAGHAAGAHARRRRAGEVPRLARHAAHEGHALVALVEQALHVGEQEEQVGLDERRHHRRQLIVVAELDLLDGDGVVLVDDRDGAGLEQRREGVARVVGARAVGEVGVGEQHLRDGDADLAEGVLVALHEHALPRRGGGLEPGHVLRSRLQAELGHAEGDRAAGDDDDAALGGAGRRDLGGEAVPGVARERLRSDLDHHPPGFGDRLAHAALVAGARGGGRLDLGFSHRGYRPSRSRLDRRPPRGAARGSSAAPRW